MATLEDVEMDILVTEDAPTREALDRWCARYPQYRRDLVDLFVWWTIDRLRPEPDYSAPLSADEQAMCDRLAEKALTRIRAMDAERRSGQ
ncbi:MAG: hypothetical protein OXC08_18795 [Thiotrichales bacterium]|nr:hypothetical protein [Thiotrichales bacterium]